MKPIHDHGECLETIIRMCLNLNAQEAYLELPGISYFWPKRPDGTPVYVGDRAITEHGDGFVVNKITITDDRLVETPTVDQMKKYFSKWKDCK